MNLYLQVLFIILAVVIGAMLVDLFRKQANFKLLLSFSGGFLLTIIFTHILPESYETGRSIGYFILVGFLLQLALEYFSQGAEHGHTHVHKDQHSFFPVAIFVSLSIHSFIEVIPSTHDHAYYWGVILHKVPEAIALKTIFNASGMNRTRSWIFVGLFGLTAPLGLIFGGSLMTMFNIDPTWILGIAIGMFLHISTTIIFESSEGHRINVLKLVAIIAGFTTGVLIS